MIEFTTKKANINLSIDEDKIDFSTNQYIKGDNGKDGGYYIPSVDEENGVISWQKSDEAMQDVESTALDLHTHGNKYLLDQLGTSAGYLTYNNKVTAWKSEIPNNMGVTEVTKIYNNIEPSINKGYVGKNELDLLCRNIERDYATKKDLENIDVSGGSSKPVIKKKTFQNDWNEAIISSALYSSEGDDLSFEILSPLENCLIVDITINYNGVDYTISELIADMLLGEMPSVYVSPKPRVNSLGSYLVAVIYHCSGTIYESIYNNANEVNSFTLHYIEVNEDENN